MHSFSLFLLPHGRIARPSWLYRLVIASLLAASFGMLADYLFGELGATVFALLYLWSACAVSTQRLHDIGKSGWSLLFFIIPIAGPIFLLFQLSSKGAEGVNRYGPDPLSRTNYLTVDITR